VLFDPSRNAVVASVALPAEPLRVTFARSGFWVVSPGSRSVFRVDTASHRLKRWRVGKEPYDAVSAGGILWVSDHDGFDVLRVRLADGSVRRSRNLGSPQLALAYAFGSLWCAGADDRLRRLDPRTLAVTGSIADATTSSEGFEPKIAAGRGAVWVSDAVQNRIAGVDPTRLRISFRGRGGGYGVAVGAGAIWAADGFTDVVRYADGRTTRVRVGGNPIDVATSPGAVWTVTRFGRGLVRLRPDGSGVAARVPLRGTPVAVATGGGLVAVALA
jgi:streptogramin lyase